MCKRVSKKNCKFVRERAEKIIQDVRKELVNKYKFAHRRVGSGNWGTMVYNLDKKEYDLDYQLVLTKKSKLYDKEKQKFPDPTIIKNDFYDAFKKVSLEFEKIENSTTAITLKNTKDKTFHIDFEL
ncbi:hypothetical protein [Metamycoplasma buccale]|uniref:hypothetical protein n=1 Tax=Metamycoplasma buccale TaxID=55602 RepID=UPI00398E97F7